MYNYDNVDINSRIIKKTSFYSNMFFLICHLGYLLLFLLVKAYILVYVDIGSICVYLLMFLIIKKKMYTAYVYISGVEITAFMCAGTILTGFNTGFHLCLIGLCILAFYSGYFSENINKRIKPLYWCITFFILYVILYFIYLFNPPYYEFNDTIKSIFYLSHVFVVFGFVTAFLYAFIKYVVKLERRIMNESRTDKLTQIPNRMALMDFVNSLGDEKNQYVLSIFDIDDFKVVNDTYGHICGDYMLKEIAKIATTSGGIDFVSRFGGEEFIIITRLNDDIDKVFNNVDDIRRKIDEFKFIFNDINIHSTITIGVAKYIDGISIDEWIEMADKKLYEGKNSGKNKTVI